MTSGARVSALAGALLAAMLACGGSDAVAPRPDPGGPPPPPPPPAAPAARIVVARDSASLKPGDTTTVGAIVVDSAGTAVAGATVTWTSATPGVVVVSSHGVLTAVQPGSSKVTASYGSLSAAVAVVVTTPWRSVHASSWSARTCALRADGTAFCWGDNHLGATGTGVADTIITRPTPVLGGMKFTQLALTVASACGLAPDGQAYCWGANDYGELGDGSTLSHGAPAPVQTSERFRMLAAGQTHVCGLTGAGTVFCWGAAGEGQAGVPVAVTSEIRTSPVQVQTAQLFTSIAAGALHTCALTADGSAYCWGWNEYDQGGTTAGSLTPWTPKPVIGGLHFVSIAAGDQFTCGVTTAGTLTCWGTYWLGTYTTMYETAPRTIDPAPPSLVAVSTGGSVPCVATASGGAACWGYAAGSRQVHDVILPTALTSLSAGAGFACAVTTRKDIFCWGDNNHGELGAGWYGSVGQNPLQVLEP